MRREDIEQRTYDPRREERRQAARVALPDDVDARTLDGDVRSELRSLVRETADTVARHLVVAGQLIDDDPERALAHARAARALAGRVGAVREACGLAAYAAGEWAEALAELRAARRISGQPGHLAVMADCERALGRPERCLAYGDDPDVSRLEQDARVELVIVLAGARRDLGQPDAAVLQLQEPARRTSATRPWAPRLWYAYADALLAAGREEQAREWFVRTAELDTAGTTDAADRLLELDGIVFDEGADDAADPDGETDDGQGDRADLRHLDLAALVARPTADAAAPPADVEPVPPDQHVAEPEPEREPEREPEPAAPEPAPPVSGVSATPFSAPAPAEELLAPAGREPIPAVTFRPAEPDEDAEMRLFD